jgi:hypothetical protein
MAFPGKRLIFAPPPRLMYQMKIFEVLWTYIEFHLPMYFIMTVVSFIGIVSFVM